MTKNTKKPRQPFVIQEVSSLSAEIQKREAYLYRAGLPLEHQKFRDRTKQLLLFESPELRKDTQKLEEQVEITGLDLSTSELRALSAIQILLERTDYKGNLPGKTIKYSEDFKLEDVYIPRLSLSFSEYLEAYGLDPKGRQYYRGKQAQEALGALESLAQKRWFIFKRKHWPAKGASRKKASVIIKTHKALIDIEFIYKDLDEDEARRVEAGHSIEDQPRRKTGLRIECSPLFVEGVLNYNFYTLKPVDLDKRIKEAVLRLYGKKHCSRSVRLFIDWIQTLDFTPVTIAPKHLAEKIGLQWLVKQRRPSKLKEELQQCLDVAKETGFLLGYKRDSAGMIIFTPSPDPEKCSRLVAKLTRDKKVEEP